MTDFVQLSVTQPLAWALVHFLWQGAAIGLASFIAFRLVRSASLRYAIGVGALVAMIAAPVTTAVMLSGQAVPRPATSTTADVRIAVGPMAFVESSAGASAAAAVGNVSIAPEALAIAVLAWLGGVTFFGIRLIGGWLVARRLTRRAVRPAADHIQAVARQLADRLAIHRAVAILQSSAVVVPVMVGWLKPAVILPVAALSGLSPSQMEALLAHELAHVRRQDYLINLLQSVAEALLFYHPAVWWLSHRVRTDRELCCDDLAVSVCDPLVYATALTDLAAMTSPGLALAATDGDLLARVRRILGSSDAAPALRAGAMPLLALGLVACVAVPVVLASAQVPVVVRPAAAVVEVPEPLASVVPAERLIVGRPEIPRSVEMKVKADSRTLQTAQQTAEQQRAEEVKRQELNRRLEELKRALAELEAQRVETIRDRVASEQTTIAQKANEASQKAREIEIIAAKRQFEEAKRQFDAGLLSKQQLSDAEAVLMKIQAADDLLAHQKVEWQRALEQLARSRDLHDRLADRNAIMSDQAAAAERVMREVQARSERVRDVAPEGQPVAASDPVRVGDFVGVHIDGEDLRMNYRVGDEGTIKMPLIGPIKVLGLTAAQVRDAVGKQLAAHKLKTVDQVKVTLTRHR